MTTEPIWHGSAEEARDLADAVAHNCTCEFEMSGAPIGTCAAHKMFADQRMLDGLLFGRYIAPHLQRQEFGAHVVTP